jgi:uncharacterized protein (TIGR03083 family)
MTGLQAIQVVHLFPGLLQALIALLSDLTSDEWRRPTACGEWSVKDISLHLLGGEIGILSRKRDGYTPGGRIASWEELVDLVNRWNEEWVRGTQRMSPTVLVDLLRHTGTQVCAYFESLDPYALGDPVSWAGPEPAPVWLDLAREYTERWHHQQHIRDAVGRPGLKEPRYLAPVLDAFVRALPHSFSGIEAAEGTLVALAIKGPSGDRWLLRRGEGAWDLHLELPDVVAVEVVIDENDAWRLFTAGLSIEQALARAAISGDRSLAMQVLKTVSIIA